MERKGSAVWRGGLKDGRGTVSTESGVLNEARYGFTTRFEGEKGTNPEELIGAAHASCFSMALSAELGKKGVTPEQIETTATITFVKQETGFTVTKSHLDLKVRIPGGDKAVFEEAAQTAKKNCPISKLLNAEITLSSTFEG